MASDSQAHSSEALSLVPFTRESSKMRGCDLVEKLRVSSASKFDVIILVLKDTQEELLVQGLWKQ